MNRKGYRPATLEALEDRSVPSAGGFRGSLLGSLPAQDAQQVLQAFETFERTYVQDVRTILLPSGTTDPSTHRAAFDTAVGTALTTLNTSIDTAIANLPTAASLTTTIQAELLGTASTSLQAELAAIPSPTNTSFRSLFSFARSSSSDISQTVNQVTTQVRTAPAPAGTIDSATVQGDLSAIDTAYQAFRTSYNSAVKTILLPSGTTDPSTNRAAFNSAVGTALTTLNTSISSALSNLPASVSASLATTISNDLLTGRNSLQATLSSLRTPRSTSGLSAMIFRVAANVDIGFSEGRIDRDVLSAVRTFNGNPTGATSMT